MRDIVRPSSRRLSAYDRPRSERFELSRATSLRAVSVTATATFLRSWETMWTRSSISCVARASRAVRSSDAALEVSVLLLQADRRLRETHIRPLQLIRQRTGDPRYTEQKYTTDDQAKDLSCNWEAIAPDLGVRMNHP